MFDENDEIEYELNNKILSIASNRSEYDHMYDFIDVIRIKLNSTQRLKTFQLLSLIQLKGIKPDFSFLYGFKIEIYSYDIQIIPKVQVGKEEIEEPEYLIQIE